MPHLTCLRPLPLVLALVASALPAQVRGSLKPATLDDPRFAPLWAETTVLTAPVGFRATPTSTHLHDLLKDRCSAGDHGRLLVQAATDRAAKPLSPEKSAVVEFAVGDKTVPVLLYTRSKVWYACSAALMRGKVKGTTLDFLDANLDGDFFGADDFMSHGGSAFRPVDADKLLILSDCFGRYAVEADGREPRFTITPLPWPAWADDGQRRAAIYLAYTRQLGAVPPLLLDEARCKACTLHAEYLYLNEYSFFTSTNDTHREDPSRPGYTKEGAEAGLGGIYFAADPTSAVASLLFTMLHRSSHLGSSGSFGIGVKVGSRPAARGTPGYTVIWSQRLEVPAGGPPAVFPAPGARGCATFSGREAPEVEDDPKFYATQRGLAVSLHYGDLPVSDIKVALFAEGRRGRTPVAGREFSHEKPIHSKLSPDNGRTAFFIADAMLPTSTWYTACFECALQGTDERMHVEWSFETQK